MKMRTRFIVALAVALVLLASLISMSRYQPIDTRIIGVSTNVVSMANGSHAAKEPGVINLPGGAVENSWIVPSGKSVIEVVATISNLGPFGVEISDIGAPIQNRPATLGRKPWLEVRVGRFGSWNKDVAFAPFVLGSHDSTRTVVRETFSCVPRPGITWHVSQLPVTTKFLGTSHQVYVSIEPFTLVLPSSC